MNKEREIDFLDVTLRDGSYTIGYQFSLLDNMVISTGLERAGVKYIEIGHGTGLGTYRIKNNYQAHSDRDYMISASKALKDSEFGFFFIPGIGDSRDIKLLRDNGGNFIRIGTSVEGFKEARKFIQQAKKLKIKFWINLMKSYVYSYEEFAEISRVALLEGAEGIYLVDSAGGMLPEDVGNYISTAKEKLTSETSVNFKLGFHGHENLSLGTACALSAVQNGADILDGSLYGIGRSIGNSPIETLAMIIKKSGYSISIDPWRLADLADKTVKPYLENRWRKSSIEQALGYKEIHSNYLEEIINFSNEKKINSRDLILSLSEKAKMSVTKKDLDTASKKIKRSVKKSSLTLDVNSSVIKDVHLFNRSLNQYITDLISKGEKTNRKTVLILANQWRSKTKQDYAVQRIRSIENNEVGAVEIFCKNKPRKLDQKLLERVNFLMIDSNLIKSNEFFRKISLSANYRVLSYPDKNSIFSHIARYISVLSSSVKYVPKVKAILGNKNDENLLRTLLEGYDLSYEESANKANIHILISCEDDSYQVKEFNKIKCLIDVRSGILSKKDVDYCFRKKLDLIALDCESAVISEVLSNISILSLIKHEQGLSKIFGVRVVAKGEWGKEGDIVVDRIDDPSIILGVSNGKGALKLNTSIDDERNIKKVIRYLYNSKLN